ncbi:MAG: hypothetical protein NTV34_00280, partial [Proteobacteria bacterium]|nr:hypothetical protein [Pseudomonadota bacterium]
KAKVNEVFMLKILKKEAHPRPTEETTKDWALVRTSQKALWTALQLPITMGYHVDNDIFINAPTMQQVSKVLISVNGVLTLVSVQNQEASELNSLKLFGIEVLGPFDADPNNMPTWKRTIARLKSKELSAYQNTYPPTIQKALIAYAIGGNSSTSEVGEDLSAHPRKATIGNIEELNIHSQNQNGSYAKGITLEFNPVESTNTQNFVLTVTASGLDLADELVFTLNEREIGKTQASVSCVDSYCQREFPIDAGLMSGNQNRVVISHKYSASSYTIKNVFLRSMEPATDEDRELVVQLLTSAERYFDERHLLIQNIKNASEAIDSAELIFATKSGLDLMRPRFSVANRKISDGFKETSADLQFKLQKELKLGHGNPAIGIINDLLKLYPEPSSRQYLMLMTQKKKLQEASK